MILGDEIDAHYEEEIKEIIELSGTPETAFAIFSDVVKNLFEWDSQEGGKQNMLGMCSPEIQLLHSTPLYPIMQFL